MSTEIAKMKPMQEICVNLDRMSDSFKESLKDTGISSDKFLLALKNHLQTHKDQNKLVNANKTSLYLACRKAANDGLLPDGREAALVVFGDEVVFMPMTQGLVKLARNSGQIANIEAQIVYSGDKFTYIMGHDEAPRHEADWFGDNRGEPIGAWAVVTLASGEKIPAMLSKSKIMRVAAKSKNAYQYDPKKGDAWEEWWKKTAIKNVLKYAPRSTALDRAIEHDNELSPIESGFEATDTEHTVIDQPTDEKPKRKSRLDKIKEAETPHDAETGEVIENIAKVEEPYIPGEDRNEDVI